MSPHKAQGPVFGPSGTALFDAVSGSFDLAGHEVVLLRSACALADTIADLEASLSRDGLVVSGSAGQPRLNGAVGELRQNRLALSRLIADLSLPIDAAGEDVVLRSPASRQASKAARARHDRDRLRVARAGGA